MTTMQQTSAAADDHLADWSDRQAKAEAMIPLVGRLYREHGVITSIHGRTLLGQSPTDILKAHRFTRRVDTELTVDDTLPVLEVLATLDLAPASIDIARLLGARRTSGAEGSLEDFLRSELADVVDGGQGDGPGTTDVVLYGFGRIGRLLARILIEHAGAGHGLRLRAIVVRKGADNDLAKRASLLRRDSVHGSFDGTITVDEHNNTILANGTLIQVIYSDDPATVDYTQYGIDDAIVVDNTGRWRDRAGLSQHLKSAGVSRVMLTAPGKGDVTNVVSGINDAMIKDADPVVSAASCTTNAIVPTLKAVNDEYGIVGGHIETVHAFTNDQNLTDNFHKGERRGRSAPLNMVLTETGAAKAVAKALPELEGKLTGNAIRVPTPNVSMAILNLTLDKDADRDSLNDYLRQTSLYGEMHKQLDFVDSPEVVSTDFVGNRHAGIVDGRATIASGNRVILYVWYDNEFGYSCQVVRVLEQMAKVHPPAFPRI